MASRGGGERAYQNCRCPRLGSRGHQLRRLDDPTRRLDHLGGRSVGPVELGSRLVLKVGRLGEHERANLGECAKWGVIPRRKPAIATTQWRKQPNHLASKIPARAIKRALCAELE